MTARLILAAPNSGSGKTLLTAGLAGAFKRRGFVVQPFKCGPDYIDSGYHALAAGRECRNLDTWLLSPEQVRMLFGRATADADVAVIEGVMGLFDGFGALDDAGSTADVARLLEGPVILVVDARGMARSAAALVAGFQQFDPRVRIGGVLLNRVGSQRHAELCATAITHHTGLPCFGYLPRRDAFKLPERHLGLITIGEDHSIAPVLEQVADALEQTCDLDALLALANTAPLLGTAPPTALVTAAETADRPVIAVALDTAFSFAYPEMFELLTAAGATIASFSPLTSPMLPPDTAGIILSGGFPELYAEQLSHNTSLFRQIKAAYAADVPIYAECGGLMYLTNALIDQQGQRWPMVGLLPGHSVMTDRLILGYRTVRAVQDGPLLPAGATIRGHEFHYSSWENRPADLAPAYQVLAPTGNDSYDEGAQLGSLVASYIHLHWLARPEMAERFVHTCWQHMRGASGV
jgi:cobyrinic acid a,c-diamide synthase